MGALLNFCKRHTDGPPGMLLCIIYTYLDVSCSALDHRLHRVVCLRTRPDIIFLLTKRSYLLPVTTIKYLCRFSGQVGIIDLAMQQIFT